MNNFDDFCIVLLEESKRFLEKHRDDKNVDAKKAYAHSCLLLSICALEAFVNSIAAELVLSPKLSMLEKSLLEEKEIKLENGQFVLSNNLKMWRLTDRIEFLYKKFKRKDLTDQEQWWATLKTGIEFRNKIVHPKDMLEITEPLLKNVLESTIKCIDVLFRAVYRKGFPGFKRGLNSRLNF